MRHASEFLPVVQQLLHRQGWAADSISHVFVSVGPGSFTGLRIGVTAARTLGWSIGARIVAVPTLDALAQNARAADPPPSNLAVVLDAKKGLVYAAAYRREGDVYRRVHGPVLASPAEFLAGCAPDVCVLGEGVDYHRPALEAAGVTLLDPTIYPARAENVFAIGLELAQAGQFTPPGDLIPLYVRRPEAEEKWEQLHPASGS